MGPRARRAARASPASSSSRSRTGRSRFRPSPPRSRRGGHAPGLDQLLQHLLNGLLLGSTYSLLGIGLTLVFGLMNVVNFAHGEFYTLGAYATFAALVGASIDFFLAIALAVLAGVLAGAVCELCLLRPLRGASIDTVMLVMIGVWIAMQNGELLGWGGV